VVKRIGADAAAKSVRLFMVPGMGHCPGTNGDNFDFDSRAIVERWRETGQAPDQLITTRYINNREAGKRLVCPYPQVAKYKGSGSVEDPRNFSCSKP
jgi:feruloyl esterase